jgi:steroid delta-isomerase-like uncharacterized protein
MSAQANSELARRLFEAFNKGDLDGCVALATDDVEVVISGMGQTFHGKDGFREFMGGLITAFPDMVITVTNQVATESEVVSECSWTGTHTGPLMSPQGEIPPSNVTIPGLVFCEVWGMRDGKVASIRNYEDFTWIWQFLSR